MAFHIRDKETDAVVRELARMRGVGLTDAVREAAQAELRREKRKAPLYERLKPIIDEIAALPKSDLKTDRTFFDNLWDSGED